MSVLPLPTTTPQGFPGQTPSVRINFVWYHTLDPFFCSTPLMDLWGSHFFHVRRKIRLGLESLFQTGVRSNSFDVDRGTYNGNRAPISHRFLNAGSKRTDVAVFCDHRVSLSQFSAVCWRYPRPMISASSFLNVLLEPFSEYCLEPNASSIDASLYDAFFFAVFFVPLSLLNMRLLFFLLLVNSRSLTALFLKPRLLRSFTTHNRTLISPPGSFMMSADFYRWPLFPLLSKEWVESSIFTAICAPFLVCASVHYLRSSEFLPQRQPKSLHLSWRRFSALPARAPSFLLSWWETPYSDSFSDFLRCVLLPGDPGLLPPLNSRRQVGFSDVCPSFALACTTI